MTSIMRNARVLATTVLLVLPCVAAQAVVPLTPAEEAAVLRLVRGTPTFARDWADGIVPMQIAAGTLRRSALLAGCAPLSRRAFSYLDATDRTAVERVLAEQQAFRQRLMGPSDGPLRNRRWLVTLAVRPDAERAAMVALAGAPHRDLLLRADSEDRVIEDFSELRVDIVTGTGEPAAVVWLKGYFERAGRLPALREAVRATAPDHLADFDRVDGFDRIGPADAPWLAALGEQLGERHEALRAALLKAYPPAVREARGRMAAFRGEMFATTLPALMSTGPGPIGAFDEALDTLYPLSAAAPAADRSAALRRARSLPSRGSPRGHPVRPPTAGTRCRGPRRTRRSGRVRWTSAPAGSWRTSRP